MEDNDIKARMDVMKISTQFVQEVLMLHQYHPPAGTSAGGLPEGWIAFFKDYFSAGNDTIGLDALIFPPERPAKTYKTDPAFIVKQIRGRRLFLRHELIRAIVQSQERKLVLEINTAIHNMPGNSGVLHLIRFLNKIFKSLRLPAHVESDFKDQYLSSREARDEVYFIVKSLHDLIHDYFIEESGSGLKLTIVKS